MLSPGSITQCIGKLQAGDDDAAQQVWQRYYARLVCLCRKRLAEHPRRAADEEDIAQVAFDSLYRGLQAGRFPRLADRTNLWRLLVVIAYRKAATQIEHDRRQKRGGGARDDSAFEAPPAHLPVAGQAASDEPDPQVALVLAEEYENLLLSLKDDHLRQIAQLKLEGYGNEEIAERLECSLRTVERRLQMIRNIWSRRL